MTTPYSVAVIGDDGATMVYVTSEPRVAVGGGLKVTFFVNPPVTVRGAVECEPPL